jgi:hypothetical protein
MKTTIDIPDAIYRQVKARAALQGQTVRGLFLEAIREKLTTRRHRTQAGWRAVFGKADKKAADEVQRIVDEEFSKIDPKDWK